MPLHYQGHRQGGLEPVATCPVTAGKKIGLRVGAQQGPLLLQGASAQESGGDLVGVRGGRARLASIDPRSPQGPASVHQEEPAMRHPGSGGQNVAYPVQHLGQLQGRAGGAGCHQHHCRSRLLLLDLLLCLRRQLCDKVSKEPAKLSAHLGECLFCRGRIWGIDASDGGQTNVEAQKGRMDDIGDVEACL